MNKCCLDNYEASCPIFETHDKYIEAWHFLTTLVDQYHNAKLFRWYLNAFIQSLRNVTFMLQAEKKKFPDFENWYAAQQQVMKQNTLLNKFKEGRNIVVKQRMLKAKSTAFAGIFRRERMKLGMDGFTLDPFTNSTELLDKAKTFFIPFMMDEGHSAIDEQIGIKRIWIVEEIGTEEIASLCCKAWLAIGDIVSNAHEALGFEFSRPTLVIERLESKYILLESDLDPTLPQQWGWYK